MNPLRRPSLAARRSAGGRAVADGRSPRDDFGVALARGVLRHAGRHRRPRSSAQPRGPRHPSTARRWPRDARPASAAGRLPPRLPVRRCAGRLPLDPGTGGRQPTCACRDAASPSRRPSVPAGAATRPAVEPAITEPAPLVAAALADVDVVRLSANDAPRRRARARRPRRRPRPPRENAAPSPVAAGDRAAAAGILRLEPGPGSARGTTRSAAPHPRRPRKPPPHHCPIGASRHTRRRSRSTVPAPPVAARGDARRGSAARGAARGPDRTARRRPRHAPARRRRRLGGTRARRRCAASRCTPPSSPHDPAATRQLQHDVGELQQALAERGFAGARIVVHDGRPADSTSHERPESRRARTRVTVLATTPHGRRRAIARSGGTPGRRPER